MLSDFFDEHIPTVDYKLKIKLFNLTEPQQEYIEIIAAYRTPNRSYVKTSARDLSAEDVDLEVLVYIIEHCHQCNMQQKFEASIVALHKFHEMKRDVALTDQLKQNLIDLFDYTERGSEPSYAWADEYSDGSQKIFYLLSITIGRNRLIKLGITSDRLRQRLALLKSDIKSKYKQHYILIEPLLIVDCADNEEFESEVKILIMEHGCQNTNYNFRGSSETFSIKCKDGLLSIAIDAAEKSGDHIIFDVNNNNGSNQQKEKEEQPVLISAPTRQMNVSKVSYIPDELI